MLSAIKLISDELVERIDLSKKRYLLEQLDISKRLMGIVGARGIGKTTMMLQCMKQLQNRRAEALYFSADNFYFQTNALFEFVFELYHSEKIKLLFIDEIHKYQNWNQELKNIYDSFPDLHVVFSGSSSIDLIIGSYDLSRRAILLHMPGLSFREYLDFFYDISLPKIAAEELFLNPQSFNSYFVNIPNLKNYFNEYLLMGYYPFLIEDKLNYYSRIIAVIEKTIYEDIASFYHLKTPNLHLFKKILTFLATIPAGELNTHILAKNCSVDNKTMEHYLTILQQVGLIRLLKTDKGGNQQLRKSAKAYLNNTTLLAALNQTLAEALNMGMMREIFFIQSLDQSPHEVFLSKKGDFFLDGMTVEIGGKNKKNSQIKELEKAYLIKEGITLATQREIPLHFFGFLY